MLNMQLARSIFYPAAALVLAASVPAVALAGDKENRRPAEPAAGTVPQCKQSVRPLTESVPLRRGECAKARRILM